jgi:hypothetical protein
MEDHQSLILDSLFFIMSVFQTIRQFMELDETNVFADFKSADHWPTYTGSFVVEVKEKKKACRDLLNTTIT